MTSHSTVQLCKFFLLCLLLYQQGLEFLSIFQRVITNSQFGMNGVMTSMAYTTYLMTSGFDSQLGLRVTLLKFLRDLNEYVHSLGHRDTKKLGIQTCDVNVKQCFGFLFLFLALVLQKYFLETRFSTPGILHYFLLQHPLQHLNGHPSNY